MSKRRFGNLLRRKFSSVATVFSSKGSRVLKDLGEIKEDEFVKSQLRDILRFGGNFVAMKMGN